MLPIPQPEEIFAWGNELHLALSQIVSGITHTSIILTLGPLHLWKQFADAFGVDEDIQEVVAEELQSSVAWQRECFLPHQAVLSREDSCTEYSYKHPPQHAPVFESPSIAWEQCIIEGHPTHPVGVF